MADLRTLIEGLGDMVAVPASADPQKRTELYEALGLRLTSHPDNKKVLVEAHPARVLAERVGGAFQPSSTCAFAAGRTGLES